MFIDEPYQPYWGDYDGYGYDDYDSFLARVDDVVLDSLFTEAEKRDRVLRCLTHGFSSGYAVGWSQPPRPADVIVSFDPRASRRDQARAVLYDYYHDDPLRYWSDNEAVKRCFIGGSDPRKETHDPLLLVAAYENKNHSVWKCQGTGMTWKDMDRAVQQAIAHRKKLGSLPKSTYDKYPLVIYYYDNDKMKRITYPGQSVPNALNPSNNRWWAWGMGDSSDAGKAAGLEDVHTRETDDPKKIQVEREHPGWVTKVEKQALKQKYPWLSDMESGSAGDWSSEGFQHDKDVAGTGVIGSITGAILALVSAILDATGVGAVIGVPLGIATPFIIAAINATDTALHAGDFGAALANLGPALAQAAVSAIGKGAGAAGIQIPPAAMQVLGTTVTAISKVVSAGQQKKLDFGQIWLEVSQKASTFKKIDDAEAEAIASMLAGPKGQKGGAPGTAGHVFIQGYLAGKFLDMTALAGIGKILQAYATFADPRIINIALLGMGIGYVSKSQQGKASSSTAARPAQRTASRSPHASRATHATKGIFSGQIFITGEQIAKDDLSTYADWLNERYSRVLTGFGCPEGYDVVSSDRQIACAYRKKAPCLAGHMGADGSFVCAEWDYPPCPPGTISSTSGPKNWCYPGAVATRTGLLHDCVVDEGWHERHPEFGVHVGETLPDWSPLSRGCPPGTWWDSLSGVCRPATPLPPHVGGVEW